MAASETPYPAVDEIAYRTLQDGALAPSLFLGNAVAAKDIDLLKSLQITHVVTAAFGHADCSDDVGQMFPSQFTYHATPNNRTAFLY